MTNSDQIDFSFQHLIYTAFVVHAVVVIFVSAVYGFAYRFLTNRFYIFLSIGWGLNACYLVVETFLLMIQAEKWSSPMPEFLTALLGLSSIPFFHIAIREETTRKDAFLKGRPVVWFSAVSACCLAGAVFSKLAPGLPPHWTFAFFILPAVIYTILVLMGVASRFYEEFSEDEYGRSARLLYTSWAAYAVVQLVYPVKLFGGIELVLYIVFFCAFCLKIMGMVTLLSVLGDFYRAASTELHESSVLADIGNMAAGLHHDIANPLGKIDAELELLQQKRHADEIVQSSLQKVRKYTKLIEASIKFVDLVRQEPDAVSKEFRPIHAREPLNFAINLFKKTPHSPRFRIVPPSDKAPKLLHVRANQNLLAEAFLNVIKNAYEAHARTITIDFHRKKNPDPEAEFRFTNDGRQLTDDERMNCFKPGWSSKEKSENRANTGMGLFMASKIIKMHRGTINIENLADGKGVVVTIAMPAARSAKQKQPDDMEEIT